MIWKKIYQFHLYNLPTTDWSTITYHILVKVEFLLPVVRLYGLIDWCRSAITMTSQWARWRLKSPAYPLFAELFVRRRSKKTSKLRVTGLCAGNSPETGEFPAQMASNAKKCFHLMMSSWSMSIARLINNIPDRNVTQWSSNIITQMFHLQWFIWAFYTWMQWPNFVRDQVDIFFAYTNRSWTNCSPNCT